MILSSISEVISIGLAIPFIGALASPEKIFEYHQVKPILELLSISSPDKIIVPFTLIFISAVLISGAIRIIMIWAQFYLSNIIGADLSILIYKKTLYQDYLSHVNRNSSEVVAGMTSI